ncbi:MAG: hypothetical protein MZU97_12560 [Bacillus subtilis]|nr:hypothetical protein [Bacillus subtilis]
MPPSLGRFTSAKMPLGDGVEEARRLRSARRKSRVLSRTSVARVRDDPVLPELDFVVERGHVVHHVPGVVHRQEAVHHEGRVDGLGQHAQEVDALVRRLGDEVEHRVHAPGP